MAEGHPLVGRTLDGRFRLTGFIGEGAMASVLRGVDLQNGGVEVAVKVMHPHLAEDRTFAGRFKREAKAAAMLTHPNSVTIITFGEDDRIHFIVMELVRGKDLREVLRVEKRLSEVRACRLVAGVCEALEAAHKLGIIHRDLKPENVMVVPDPEVPVREHVKVLDFGIAKLVDNSPKQRVSDGGPDSDPPPALTQVGVVVGTPAYMSPEQCRGQPLDGRSDLYTCGILLYQLVVGRVPFDSESPFETAGKQAFEAPPPPSQFLPTITPDLEALILRLLSKSADDRPQSATELRETLIKLIGQIQGRMGKTMPMMASKPILAAAEARAADLAGAVGGVPLGVFPNLPGLIAPPPAGSVGPRGTLMEQRSPDQQKQGPSLPDLVAPPPPNAPLQSGHDGFPNGGATGDAFQSAPAWQVASQPGGMGYGAEQQQGGGYPRPPEAQSQGQAGGYPKAPSPQDEGDEPRGRGGLAVLMVLLAMFVGVGIGVALFRFL